MNRAFKKKQCHKKPRDYSIVLRHLLTTNLLLREQGIGTGCTPCNMNRLKHQLVSSYDICLKN